MTVQITRKSVLTGVAAGFTSIPALAIPAFASESAHPSTALETKYDLDLLVVGGGIAGLCAAIQAIDLGVDPKRVLIVDKMSGDGADYGGSSLVMSGNYLLATDTSEEGKAAFADAMYAKADKVQNYDLLTVLAQNANDTLDWLMGLGCGYNEGNPGEEACYTRAMSPDARAVPVLIAAYEERGGKIAYGTKVWHLVLDAEGVCGATASDANGFFEITTRKTVLATGGFLSNPGMMEEFIGENAGLITPRAPWSITGDGLTMVEEVGGCIAGRSHGMKACYLSCTHADNLTKAHASRVAKLSVAVNIDGERYTDESDSSQASLRRLVDQPGCMMATICDNKRMEELEPVIKNYDDMGVSVHTFDTLDEVAGFIGCPSDTLQATIEDFNAHVVDDHTEGLDFDKTSGAMTVDEPPYYVFFPFKLTSSFLGAGVATDTSARVVGADSVPIPNLYAAGEIQGGFAYDEYFHGANNAKAAVFGRIAGQQASAEL